MKLIIIPLSFSMMILTLAACSTSNSTNLTDQVWNLTQLSGKSLVTGSVITAEFTADGKVSGTAGCNQYSGTYQANSKKISFSPNIATTRMSCDAAVNVQESAYLKALGEAKTYAISGEQLTLFDVNQASLAVYQMQVQNLAGTLWNAISYNNGKQAVTSVLTGTSITASFGTDGVISGSSGCNTYSGSYKVDGNRVTISQIISTQMACSQPAGVMEQETQFLVALQTAATFKIQGNRLELRTSEGVLAVQFNSL